MSTKSKGPSKSQTTTVGTESRNGLTAEEERALRMRFGLAGDDDTALPQKHEGNAEIAAKLREIEKRAFAMAGRTPGEMTDGDVAKAKIVSALRDKTQAAAPKAGKPTKKRDA